MVSVTPGTAPAARRPLGLVGVPTSAGSHNAGQEGAPAALRAAGLVDRLAEAGVEVHDHGDTSRQGYRPSERDDGVRDLDRVLAVARECADVVRAVVDQGRALLVLGGDCTITLGVVAGLREAY